MIEEKYLRGIKLYELLTPKDRSILANCLVMEKLRPGTAIFRTGDSAKACYIVLNGSVRLFVESMEVPGRQKLLDEAERGELFGEACLIDRGCRFYSVKAGEKGVVLANFGINDFTQILHAENPFSFRLWDVISSQIAWRAKKSTEYLSVSG